MDSLISFGDFLAGNFLAHAVTFRDFMAGDFLAGDFLAHRVTFGDFMAGNFLAGDFLGGYLIHHMKVRYIPFFLHICISFFILFS